MENALRIVLVTLAVVAIGAATAVVTLGRDAGAASSPNVKVRSFEDVQASEPEFERDATDPSRGIFRVQTTEPMICAIVWGRDDRFGRFNNSLSMNGTGITDHNVLLPDVKAGVRYRYVIQGTTADGSLYRSEVGTFRLAAGEAVSSPAALEGLQNVAVTATVIEASSEFSATFGAPNAIDDDPRTEWATKRDGNKGSITLDLGRETDVEAVEFVTRSMPDGSSITSRYTVMIDDGPATGPYPAATLARPRLARVTGTGRVIRFDVVRSTGGNVGAVEIRVYTAA
jgi:hypothetical protein